MCCWGRIMTLPQEVWPRSLRSRLHIQRRALEYLDYHIHISTRPLPTSTIYNYNRNSYCKYTFQSLIQTAIVVSAEYRLCIINHE
jgi:hypothetical protein